MSQKWINFFIAKRKSIDEFDWYLGESKSLWLVYIHIEKKGMGLKMLLILLMVWSSQCLWMGLWNTDTYWVNAICNFLFHCFQIKWEDGFEPYILGKKEEMPPYRQRFLARVRNKTSQIMELYYMGYGSQLLSNTTQKISSFWYCRRKKNKLKSQFFFLSGPISSCRRTHRTKNIVRVP